jgi:hypothetical protein
MIKNTQFKKGPTPGMLEFLLTVDGNYIIQRYFYAPNYNSKAKNSMDLFYCVDEICEKIAKKLKMKNLEYMSDINDYNLENNQVNDEEINQNEYFKLEIKRDNAIFISRIFPAYVYHPKVRYSVDIREDIKEILGDLTDVFSSTELEDSCMGYKLNK